MSGAGRKPVVDTYRTARDTYREVSVIDASIDTVTAIIDTRTDENGSDTVTGANSMLALYILLEGMTGATLELYSRATEESPVEPVSSSSSGGGSSWVFHSEITVDAKGLLHVLRPLPADQYKVMVTAVVGTGTVTIRESHSA